MPDPVNRFRQLNEAHILATLSRLRERIAERFPDSGLSKVAEELLAFGRETTALTRYLRQPLWPIRIAVGVTIALIITLVIAIVVTLQLQPGVNAFADLVQTTEAAINDIIFLGIAIFFLVTLEGRIKRRRALAALHQLRSVAHIVDMHQLTKDPEKLVLPPPDTASSPRRAMAPAELGRYLDYCSELLSLVAKLAALHVQDFGDPVVLGAVTEIETLTSSLSSKIWQKITLLERAAG